jgi:hypothetical protein
VDIKEDEDGIAIESLRTSAYIWQRGMDERVHTWISRARLSAGSNATRISPPKTPGSARFLYRSLLSHRSDAGSIACAARGSTADLRWIRAS